MDNIKLISDELYDILGEVLNQNKDIKAKVRKLQAEKELLKSMDDETDTLIII